MAAIEESVNNVVSVLPPELASQIISMMGMLKTIGALFMIYLIFYIVRFYFMRKRNKMIDEMMKDVKDIKKSLGKKSKK